jgi:hypothetical protein
MQMRQGSKYLLVTVALFFALSFCFERRAYGYVDPGSGLLIFQSLSALVTGALFYFRRGLKSMFTRSREEKSTSSDQPL